MSTTATPTNIAAPQALAPMAGSLKSAPAPATAVQMGSPTPQAAPPVAAALQPPLTPTLARAEPTQPTPTAKAAGGSCTPVNGPRQQALATQLQTPANAPQVLTPISTLPTS